MLLEAALRDMLMTQVKVDGEWTRVRYFGKENLIRLIELLSACANTVFERT